MISLQESLATLKSLHFLTEFRFMLAVPVETLKMLIELHLSQRVSLIGKNDISSEFIIWPQTLRFLAFWGLPYYVSALNCWSQRKRSGETQAGRDWGSAVQAWGLRQRCEFSLDTLEEVWHLLTGSWLSILWECRPCCLKPVGLCPSCLSLRNTNTWQ